MLDFFFLRSTHPLGNLNVFEIRVHFFFLQALSIREIFCSVFGFLGYYMGCSHHGSLEIVRLRHGLMHF